MSRDFWGFTNIKELEQDIKDMPDAMLNEQFDIISQKTNYILFGKASTIKLRKDKPDEVGYSLATLFSLQVPNLDNYIKTILIMYSNPENEYPIAITVGKSYDEDMEEFQPSHKCDNREDFEAVIKEILSSSETMQIVKLLYSKAYMLSVDRDSFDE